MTTKAKKLATFMVQNLTFCPIDYDKFMDDCDGWGCRKCVDCILQNTQAITTGDTFKDDLR